MKKGARTLLAVSDLRLELGGHVLFQGLHFDLAEKETLVVLGPNGAGKTVLLKTLLGLIPCQGKVSWSSGVKIGYVPQRVPLNRDLPVTVKDFFGLKGIDADLAGEALSDVGVRGPDFLMRQLGLLSSGQFQRVLIAWALAGNPDVLLFDEPLAGIDVGGEETIYTLLRRTQKKRKLAVVLVTHDLSTVYSLASNVLCINGKIFCYGRPREVLTPRLLQEIYGSEMKFFRHAHG
jgi:zinc transport system ATP-binding protein